MSDQPDTNGNGHHNTLDELLTTDELADLLGMRKSTVQNYARRGVLPSLKLGRHRRFIRSDVIHALDELRNGTH
jgi:excisionase family DNA binding protein